MSKIPKWHEEFDELFVGGFDALPDNSPYIIQFKAFIENQLEMLIDEIPDRLTDTSYQETASMLKQELKSKWLTK